MAKEVIFGKPFETEAIVGKVERADSLENWQVTQRQDKLVFRCALNPNDIVYGLGEQVKGINKRGGRYVSYNTDNPHQTDESLSLYGSHNVLIIDGDKCFGAFFDTPSKVLFEIDVDNSGEIVVTCEPNVKVVELQGESAYAIAREFLSLIGTSYIPPLWAFGFGQSRWGYKTQKDFDSVVDGYRNAGIPLDWVCMDIDYMDRYIDFTVNTKRFPDLAAYVGSLKAGGIRLVPIIDAGVKVEPHNDTYETGVANGYFCTNHEGKPFKAGCGPE